MSSDSPDSDIRKFYSDASLPEGRIDAILLQGRSIAEAQRWKRYALASSLGLVGMTVVCCVLLIRLQNSQGDPAVATEETTIPDDMSRIPEQISPETPEPRPEPTFRLVGVRSHGDRCGRCRAAAESFAVLRERFQGRSIEFLFFDLHNAENLAETDREMEALHLNALLEGRRDKALLALAGPTGEIQELDVNIGLEQLERQIAGYLEQE
jgi:hypothetical protein